MSKQMKSAYFALRLKDTMELMAGSWCLVAILAAALLAACILDVATHSPFLKIIELVFTIATVVCACFHVVSVLCIKWCTERMHKMGYNEVELERLALA